MSQRDTMIPVCKIVEITANTEERNIPLAMTAVGIGEITYNAQPSCMPNQVMELTVSGSSQREEPASGSDPDATSATANVRIERGIIQNVTMTNIGSYNENNVKIGGVSAMVPVCQLSSVSLGTTTVQYVDDNGTVVTSSNPSWVSAVLSPAGSAVDRAQTLFGLTTDVVAGTSAIISVTYHQRDGALIADLVNPGNAPDAGQFAGKNYQIGTNYHPTANNTLRPELSGVTTTVGSRNGGNFDLSSSWYQCVSSVGGDASACFYMVSSHVSNPFEAKVTTGLASPNYVSVTDLSGATGFFRVSPASGSFLYASGATLSSAPMKHFSEFGADMSGLPGVVAGAGTTAVLSLNSPVSYINIENHSAQTDVTLAGMFAINYGVIKQSNTVGDSQTPDVR